MIEENGECLTVAALLSLIHFQVGSAYGSRSNGFKAGLQTIREQDATYESVPS
jgi:hypothetical protein